MDLPRTHIVLSPHLDDGVLSCGPFISSRLRQGEQIVVLTVFSGRADPSLPLPPAAGEDYERIGGDPMPLRRAEEADARAVLGHEVDYLDLPELIFRFRANGEPRVRSLDDIYGAVSADDMAVVEAVVLGVDVVWSQLVPDVVHAPLGVGNHIDHVIVRRAAERLAAAHSDVELVYYDDMPYALTEPLTGEATSWDVDDEDIERWIEAVGCYSTQTKNMFEDRDWQTDLRNWARSLRPNSRR